MRIFNSGSPTPGGGTGKPIDGSESEKRRTREDFSSDPSATTRGAEAYAEGSGQKGSGERLQSSAPGATVAPHSSPTLQNAETRTVASLPIILGTLGGANEADGLPVRSTETERAGDVVIESPQRSFGGRQGTSSELPPLERIEVPMPTRAAHGLSLLASEHATPGKESKQPEPNTLFSLSGPGKTIAPKGESERLKCLRPSDMLEPQRTETDGTSKSLDPEEPSKLLELPGPSQELGTQGPSKSLAPKTPSRELACPGASQELGTQKPSHLLELKPSRKRAYPEPSEELAIRRPRRRRELEERENGLADPTISEQPGAQWPRVTRGPGSPNQVHQRSASRSVNQDASSRESVLPDEGLSAEPAAARGLTPHKPAERAYHEQQHIPGTRCFRKGGQWR
jgi:hypothetical protein